MASFHQTGARPSAVDPVSEGQEPTGTWLWKTYGNRTHIIYHIVVCQLCGGASFGTVGGKGREFEQFYFFIKNKSVALDLQGIHTP